MNTRLPGKFLQKKLTELNNALFFAEGNALIKLPNSCITEMDVTEEGKIIFVLPKPAQDITAFDTEFPVRLDFFKKGKPFRLKVQGKGILVSDHTEIITRCAAATQLQHKAGADVIMIKVQPQFVDYTGPMNDSFSDRIKNAGAQLSDWLFAGNSLSLSE